MKTAKYTLEQIEEAAAHMAGAGILVQSGIALAAAAR